MIWLSVIVFIVLLLVLVLAHELGHFVAAKRAGCKVEEFAFGFPPRLWSVVKGETRYSFNLLPIGGYVKIEGEDMQETDPSPTSFGSKSASWRLVILVAGVLMNVLLATILLSWQAGIGVPTLVTKENQNQLRDFKTFVVGLDAGSPADVVGIKPLDRVVNIGDESDPTIDVIQAVVSANVGQEVSIEIERQGMHETHMVVPRENPPPGEGAIGVALQETGLAKTSWWLAPWAGIVRTGDMLAAIFIQFGILIKMWVTDGGVGDVITGPVGIAVYTNEVTKLGASYVLEFAALISLNLAIINILPIPALDGGRILFVLVEVIVGKRLPKKIENASHMTGFVLLILLMILITLKDVGRFF